MEVSQLKRNLLSLVNNMTEDEIIRWAQLEDIKRSIIILVELEDDEELLKLIYSLLTVAE